MEKQAPIPDEATMEAIAEHDALTLSGDDKKLNDFLKLTLIKHALKDAALGEGDDREAAAARKRFADVASKLQSED